MKVFHHEELSNPSKRCKFLTAGLKDALSNCHTLKDAFSDVFSHCHNLKDSFSNCHTIRKQQTASTPEEEYMTSDFEDEQELVVSMIRSRAMEKLRQKPSLLTDSFSWVFSPTLQELYMTSWEFQLKEDKVDNEKKDFQNNEKEDFETANSCFSCCSGGESREAFFSVRTNLSRSSSFNRIEYQDLFQRRSIFQEFCHCEGWPFGLCRKAVLLPPLPKSPSESWSWHKRTTIVKKLCV